ncbi:MAG: hypothetical protein MUF85_02580, partial [Patescibacteria group bacterium]|nr:hypothetical protein [Patescibacteria group bacterium]
MSEFHDRCSVFLYPEESVYPFTDLRVELPAPDTDKLKENLREVLNTIQNDVNRIIEGDIGGEIEGLVLDTAAGIIALNHSITVILIEEFRRMIATPGLAGDLFGSCDKAQRAAKDKKHITEMAFDLPPNEQSWRSNPIVYAKEHDFDTLRNSMYAVEFQIIDADGSLTGSTIILPVWI